VGETHRQRLIERIGRLPGEGLARVQAEINRLLDTVEREEVKGGEEVIEQVVDEEVNESVIIVNKDSISQHSIVSCNSLQGKEGRKRRREEKAARKRALEEAVS
jgi:hypothetical protein